MWSNGPASLSHAAAVASPFGALRTTMPVRAHDGPAGSTSHQLPPSVHGAGGDSHDLTPLPWSAAFAAKQDVKLPAPTDASAENAASAHSTEAQFDSFCVYTAGPAASTADPPFVVLLLHGGGHSSLAWACVAAYLKSTVHVMSIDLRGHGSTRTQNEADLSMARMTQDTIAVVQRMYARVPPLLLIGHSLGAALAVHVATSKQLPVCGLVMVDLVEGSAVDSLQHMRAIVQSRPSSFQSPAAAVAWALRVGAMRNPMSARFSVPDQLQQGTTTQEDLQAPQQTMAEEDDDSSSAAAVATQEEKSDSSTVGLPCWRWRTDLLSSEPYWAGWFAGLSSLFLSCTMPKLLLLASAERLDPPLMVAHMQGKMQVDVLADAGHSLQEDQPADTARKILAFVARHKLHQMAEIWARGSTSTSTSSSGSSGSSGTTLAATSFSAVRAVPPVPLFDAK